jgi:hypothetical protein
MDQTIYPAHLQVDNNRKNLTKLDFPKNILWLISYELNNRK